MATAIVPKQISRAMVQTLERVNKPNPLWNQAIEIMTARQQWPNGHSETLLDGQLRGKRSMVYLKNVGGFIKLFVYVAGKTAYTSAGFMIGILDFSDGYAWRISNNATLSAFNAWQKKQCSKITRLEDQGRL